MATALRFLHRQGPQTRAALSKELSASRSAVGVLLAALADLDLIRIEEPAADGRVGRPSPVVSVGRVGPVAVCIASDPEAGTSRVVCIGLGGTVIARQNVPQVFTEHSASLTALLTNLAASLPPRNFIAGAMLTVGRHIDPMAAARTESGCFSVDEGTALPLLTRSSAELAARGELARGSGMGKRSLLYVDRPPDYEFFAAGSQSGCGHAGSVRLLLAAMSGSGVKDVVPAAGDVWQALRAVLPILRPDVLVLAEDLPSQVRSSGRSGDGVEVRSARLGGDAAFHGGAEVLLRAWWHSPLTAIRQFRRFDA